MEYLTIKQVMDRWGLTTRWVQILWLQERLKELLDLEKHGLFLQMLKNKRFENKDRRVCEKA